MKENIKSTPAAAPAANGELGNGLTWALKDGLLTISGTGAIPDSSFAPWYYVRTNITSVVIDNTVTEIGDRAFRFFKSLMRLAIPDSVTYIGERAFYSCTSLTSIDVDEANSKYSSVDGVLFNKDMTTLICCPGGKEGAYTIPDSVTTIGNGAFYSCKSLTSVTIPDSVTTIGNGAFCACDMLTSVAIPDSVTEIGESAFNHCRRLMNVTIPDSVTTIGKSAFYYCYRLTSVTIGNSITSIGEDAFKDCSSDLILHVGKNSYAKEYAKRNNIKYKEATL